MVDPFVVFLISGLIFLTIGISMLIKRRSLIRKSKVINGTVIEIQRTYSRGKVVYYPVIEYLNEDQIAETFIPKNGDYIPKNNRGDIIELRYYNDGIKKQLYLNTWYELWGTPVFLIAIAFAFSILCLISKN